MKNNIAKLDHINFTVENFNETVKWYKNIFNFDLVESGFNLKGNKWGILKSGDTMLAITEYPNRKSYIDDSYHKVYHFGLRLIDKSEWLKKLKAFRLETFYSSPVNYPNSTSWYVKDPTGHEIEVAIWNQNKVIF